MLDTSLFLNFITGTFLHKYYFPTPFVDDTMYSSWEAKSSPVSISSLETRFAQCFK